MTKLQFNTHSTYYLHNKQKDLKLHLDRASRGYLNRIGYWLRVTAEPMGNNGGLAD
jgi:hypothetical protein